MTEDEFLALLRPLAGPGSRGLRDDAAVLDDGLVITKDMIACDVHYRAGDAPADVAWKLLAVNLSDLAAKGARPIGVLLGFVLGEDGWDRAFADGLRDALAHFETPLLGGDTVRVDGPRVLSLTALGRCAAADVPDRRGARAGDALWVTGRIGLAGLGLRREGGAEGRSAYLRPQPRLEEGAALAGQVTAMMDVSDGLLIDATRMAAASGLAVSIELAAVPVAGDPWAAVVAGDDYELLFALPDGVRPNVPATRIGDLAVGAGLSLTLDGVPVAVPPRLGWTA